MNADSSFELTTYCDSDWAACPNTRKSVSRFFILLGKTPLSWKSKKQQTIALSSAEAEYRSMRRVCAELAWLTRLLDELTVSSILPVPLKCDNQEAIHIAIHILLLDIVFSVQFFSKVKCKAAGAVSLLSISDFFCIKLVDLQNYFTISPVLYRSNSSRKN